MRRTDRYRYPFMMTLLVVLQFTLRSHLGGDRIAPDFLLLALLLYTIRAEPGKSALAGFIIGLLRDAMTVVSFGAGMRSEEHTSELQSLRHLVCRLLLE